MEQHQFEFFEDEEEDTHIDLIQVQQHLLRQILNLGLPDSEAGDEEDQEIEVGDGQSVDKKLFTFKVLIFDQQAQNILAPVMKVGNLRESNVTLHLNLNSKRDPIPDIPAIYLVYEAKDEIIKRIAEDAMNCIYDYFFINFCRQPTQEQINTLALEMIKANAAHKICRVGFSHLNYQVISQDLFILSSGKSNFKALYSNNEQNIDQSIEPIAQSLYSMFRSIGTIPYVRVLNNDISDKVAKRLQQLFQKSADEVQQSPIRSSSRPLLIVLDRNLDLHTMFYHSWNYLSLIQDIFGVKNNQFYYQEDAKSKPQQYNLDYAEDEFLKENMFKDFHEAAENVDKTLNQWKNEYDQINKMTGGGQVGDISSNLTSAIDQLPQMTERKKKIDMHVQIASRILSEIKRRGIDKLQDIEDEIMTQKSMSNATKLEFMNVMRKETNTPQELMDKMRLLLIFIHCSSDIQEIKNVMEVLKQIHGNEFEETTIQNILKKRKDFENQADIASPDTQNQQSFIGGLAKQVTKGSKSLLSNLSNMLAEQKNLIHYNIVKKCIQNVQSKYITQNEYYMDLKTGQRLQMVKEQIKDVVVFVCGGGSYYEYQCMHNLQTEMKVQILYGSDYMFSQEEFLQEIMKLNRK